MKKEILLDFIEALSHIYKRDIKHLITGISGSMNNSTPQQTEEVRFSN